MIEKIWTGVDLVSLQKQLSAGTFNLVLGGIVLYGLAVNLLTALLLGPLFRNVNPIALCLVWLACAIIGILCTQSRKLWMRVLAFHLIVIPNGPVLSAVLGSFSGNQVLLAIALTAVITAGMILLAARFPHFFARLGTVLLMSLCLTLAVSLVTFFLGIHLSVLSLIFVLIFSLYIGYDWHKAQTCEKTLANAIEAAIDLYLDIINIFLDLLDILDWLD